MSNRFPTAQVRAIAVAGLAGFVLVMSATPAAAAPASAAATGVTSAAVTAQALPSYPTWVADVTAVTNVAAGALSTRLPDRGIRAAIVVDIDNTALESGYSSDLVTPATRPVLALAKQAEAAGAVVFFVTARPEIIGAWTEFNLRLVGYSYAGIYLRPTLDFESNQALKTNARIAIERLGYTIVANIGNSDSDLAGGHAERTFKLPDYGGQLS